MQRWLNTLRMLVAEYALTVDIILVKSNTNLVDQLTRVPKRWLNLHKEGTQPVQSVCAAAKIKLDAHQVANIHRKTGHPGMKRTLYFVRLIDPSVSSGVVKECEACQTTDPAPVHWQKG